MLTLTISLMSIVWNTATCIWTDTFEINPDAYIHRRTYIALFVRERRLFRRKGICPIGNTWPKGTYPIIGVFVWESNCPLPSGWPQLYVFIAVYTVNLKIVKQYPYVLCTNGVLNLVNRVIKFMCYNLFTIYCV